MLPNLQELLSGDYPHPEVRSFAIARIADSPDDELIVLLPQLVQALRFEPAAPSNDVMSPRPPAASNMEDGEDRGPLRPPASQLESLLLDRCCSSVRAASLLHWHLTALWEDPRDGPMYVGVHSRFYER